MAERVISQAIKTAEADLRKQYPLLNYQDLIGTLIFVGSIIGIFGCWAVYIRNDLTYTQCAMLMVPIMFFTSLLHELEHDLIHNLYFKKTAAAQDFMFFCIWLSKLHGNPWFRRELHLKHHIISGQVDDAEERLIGLGLPFGLTRMAVTMHPFGSLIITPAVGRDAKWMDVQKLNLTSAPVAFLFFGLNKAYMVYIITMYVVGYDNYANYLPAALWPFLRASAVLVCFPNILRQACLVMMSNCSHYYGDIPEKSVTYQNQILDHWTLYIFQMFCMNFGATHIVHHYVPGQPFYIRELVYRKVKQFMIDKGVRYNDFGIVSRGNRYFDDTYHDSANATDIKAAGGATSIDTAAAATTTQDDSTSKHPTGKISANGSHLPHMLLWALLCSTVGLASYIVFDQWTTMALGRRIVRKYVTKVKGE